MTVSIYADQPFTPAMQTALVIAVVIVVLYILFKVFKALIKWLVIGIVVILAVAFFSNPDFDQHRNSLSDIKKELRDEIKEKKIIFDDYKIFSLTKKKVNGKEKIVGVGVFGKVWYFGDEE